MATTQVTPIPNPTPVATTQPAPVDTSTAQSAPQVTAPVAAKSPAQTISTVAATPADSSAITPGEDTDEGLTAHTQLSLEQAPYAVRKWLDIPAIKATKQAIPEDAEDYTGGRLPQSGVKSGDTKNIGVYNGHNYVHDQDGMKSAQFPVHEAVHMVQNMLPKSFTDKFPKEDPKDPYKDLKLTAEDLAKLRKSGDTLWKHSREGQASLMQKYVARHEWLTKKATPQEVHDYMTSSGDFKGNGNAKFEQAYAPYLDDAANAPVPKGDDGVQINSTPMPSPALSTSYAVQAVSGHPAMDGQIPGQTASISTGTSTSEQNGDAPTSTAPDGTQWVTNPNYVAPPPSGDQWVSNPNYVAPTVGGGSNPLAIDADANNTFKGAVQQLNSVGAGIGEGVLSTVNGAADMLHLPHATLEARQKELETNNAQNPVEHAIGYGGETLMELIGGDEALKGMSLADKLMATSKIAKVLESSPRITQALKVGADLLAKTGKVGEIATGAAASGARLATAQGAQTLARTGGDVDAAAKQAAIAGVTGGAAEGALSTVGAGLRAAGDTADGVKDLNTTAANVGDRPSVVQSISQKLQAADKLRHTEFENGIQDLHQRLGDASVEKVGSPIADKANELLLKPDPDEDPDVAAVKTAAGDKLDKPVRDILTRAANGGEMPVEPAKPVSTGILDENGKPVMKAAPVEETDPQQWKIDNLIKYRQSVRDLASQYDYGDVNSRALRALLPSVDDTIDNLAEQSSDATAGSDYKALRSTYREKSAAFNNPVIQKLMKSTDMDGNLVPGHVTDAANDFITQAKANGGKLSGKTVGNVLALRTALGDKGTQEFGTQVVHNLLQDATDAKGNVNPAKFQQTWNDISKETKGSGLFDLTPDPGTTDPATLEDAATQWAHNPDPLKRGLADVLSDAHSAAKLQQLTKGVALGAGAYGMAHLPFPMFGDIGMGFLGLLGAASEVGGVRAARTILDAASDRPWEWNVYRKLGKAAASKSASGAADVARVAAGHGAAEGFAPAPDRKAIKNAYRGAAGALGATQ